MRRKKRELRAGQARVNLLNGKDARELLYTLLDVRWPTIFFRPKTRRLARKAQDLILDQLDQVED